MLGCLRVGTGGEENVVGGLGGAGVDLAAVDQVVVILLHGAGLQGRQVRPGGGLRVADGKMGFTGGDARQEALLLLLRPVIHDGRPDRVKGDEGGGRAGEQRFFVADELFALAEVAAAVFLRPSQRQHAVLALLPDQALVQVAALGAAQFLAVLGLDQVGEIFAQFLPEGFLAVGIVDEHGLPPFIRAILLILNSNSTIFASHDSNGEKTSQVGAGREGEEPCSRGGAQRQGRARPGAPQRGGAFGDGARGLPPHED